MSNTEDHVLHEVDHQTAAYDYTETDDNQYVDGMNQIASNAIQSEHAQSPRPTEPEFVQAHIRGFYTDTQNKNTFAINYDTTSAEEQQRRRDRLARFGGEDAAKKLERLDQVQADQALANKRLERFSGLVSSSLDTQNNTTDDDFSSNFPEIMPFEELHRVPQEQIDFEIRGFQPTAPRRWDTIHLFGTRLLAENVRTEDLMNRYKDYGLTKVEWQSDYRCNLVFADQYAARRVLDLESYHLPLNVVRAKSHFPIVDPTKSEAENATSFEEESVPFMIWRQSTLSEEFGDARGSLAYRLATANDIKEPLEVRKHSQFYLDNMQYFAGLTRRRRAALDHQNREIEKQLQLELNAAIEAHAEESLISEIQERLIQHKQASINPRAVTTVTINKEEALPLRQPKVIQTTMKHDQNENAKAPVLPQGARGRGFLRGRPGAFSDTGLHIQKNNSRMDDRDTGSSRQRDRTYREMPRVDEHTPLMVTVNVIQENLQRRKEQEIINQQKQEMDLIKRQNNAMARVPINYEETRKNVPLPPERVPRQTSDLPQDINIEPIGMNAMFLADQQERELQLLKQQQEAEALKKLSEAHHEQEQEQQEYDNGDMQEEEEGQSMLEGADQGYDQDGI